MNKKKKRDSILLGMMWISTIITVGILLWIVIYVIINGIGEISLSFLTTKPTGEEGGILPMIISTIYMILITISIATPIGIFSAIYLVEYAQQGRIVRMIRFTTENLAGIPSIIYGLFGYMFFVVYLKLGFSLISGALTMSIMILPTIIRTTEEALKTIPIFYREGSLGLGASKLRTIRLVVLPNALPGISTAIVLSIGRIVGETAAIYLTAGMGKNIPTSFMDSGRTLSVHLYMLAKEGISFEKAYATATVLIFIVLIINLSAHKIVARITRGRI